MLRLKQITKQFGAVPVLQNLNLEIHPGEFFCLLGPSGCGKTTLLRLIAGFEIPQAGQIFWEEKELTHLPPYERGCAMVFQNDALWPHMTVFENIAYGLESQKLSRAKIATEVATQIEAFQLHGLEKRLPQALSGGQQQRVALARAMAVHPQVLLMDEPYSHLDAQLRKILRRELKAFHAASGCTVIYVTHDQEEALALADRLGVMEKGDLLEVGHPRTLYGKPKRLATARVLGDLNLLENVTVKPDGIYWQTLCISRAVAEEGLTNASLSPKRLGLRPEHILIFRDGVATAETAENPLLVGRITAIEFAGPICLIGLNVAGHSLWARLVSHQAQGFQLGDTVKTQFNLEEPLWL